MDGLIIPIIAVAAALGLFAVWQFIAALTNVEKRRLKQRLANDNTKHSGGGVAQLSILAQQQDTGLSGQLSKFSLFDSIQERLNQAYPDASLAKFVIISLAVSVTFFITALLVSNSLIVAPIAALAGAYIPVLVVNQKRNKRQRLLADQLPEALDFLSRVLRAGHSLSTGLQMMGEELPAPLAGEFQHAYDDHSLGLSLEDALKSMAKRIDSTDFAFFITAVLIQRQTGGDLSEVLSNISGMIRQRIRLQSHVKAKTAEGRFTGYILSAFPGIMFFIAYMMNPSYTGVLLRTTLGLELLGAAFLMQMLGLYCIRKITTVKV
ncbi:MAG: type II secretion system F family protein [Phycisphaerae bacterium]|nr:type II secretion system F family protein [Phycisphaerae bacterium]